GSNVAEIREFFWKWRRSHSPRTESNLGLSFGNLLRQGEVGMSNLGVFGDTVVEELTKGMKEKKLAPQEQQATGGRGLFDAAPKDAPADATKRDGADEKPGSPPPPPPPGPAAVEPTVRKNF